MADNVYNFSAERDAFQRMLDSYGELLKNHRDILDMFRDGMNQFGRNADEINKTIERSPTMKKYYDELKSLLIEMTTSREEMLKAVKSVSDKYVNVANEDVKSLMDLKKEYENLTKVLDDNNWLTKRGTLRKKLNKDETAAATDILNQRRAVNDEIDKLIKKSEQLKLINERINKNNTDEHKSYEKYNQELEKTEETSKKILENQNKSAQTLEEIAQKHKEVEKAVGKVNLAWELGGKLVRGIAAEVKNAVKTNWDMENAAYKTAKSMAMTKSQAQSYHRFMLKAAPELMSTLGLPLEEVIQFQKNYSSATGRSINLTKDQMKIYGSMSKLLGEDVTIGMIEELDKLGASLYEAGEQSAKLIGNAQKQGLNLSKASAAFVKNMKLAHSYNFRNGVDGIRKMTMLSERLKFNLESIASAADNMNSIEGSISTAANIQKLGGSFAMNFSDPMRLMYESWNDFEGLTERIVNTVQGRATFNRQTGEMQMGSLDRRFLQEFAKAINIPFEDIYQMATQQAKYQDMESSFQRGLSEEQRTAVGNRAQWNAISGQYEVTYYDKQGTQRTRALSEIDSSIADTIMVGNDTEDAILAKTGDILTTAQSIERLVGRAQGLQTDSEIARAIQESKNVTEADWYENIFSDLVGDILRGVQGAMANSPALTTGGLLAGGALLGGGSFLLNRQIGKVRQRTIENAQRRAENAPTTGTSNPPSPSSNGRWGRVKGALGRAWQGTKRIAGKAGKFAIPAAIAVGLASLLGFKSEDEATKNISSTKTQAEKESSVYYDDSMSEMERQTKLLEQIAKNTSGDGIVSSNVNLPVSASKSKLGASLSDASSVLGFANSAYSIGGSLFSKQLLNAGKFIPGVGLALGGGYSLLDGFSALANNKGNISELNALYNSGQIDKAEYIKRRKENSSNVSTSVGNLIGSAIGTTVGAAIGSLAGGVGAVPGAAVGQAWGSMLGSGIGYLTSDGAVDISKEMEQTSRVNAYDYETSKFGQAALSGNNVGITALKAQIKSSDILGSIYDLLSKKFDSSDFQDEREAKIKHDIGERNWKWYDPFGWGKYNDSWSLFSNGGIIKASNGIASIPGNSYSGDKVMARVNSGEMILNKNQQGALFKWIDSLSPSNIIKGISDYAKPTFISKDKGVRQTYTHLPSPSNNVPTNINLNVSGTIKLEGNNGRSVDLREVLNSPQFRKELTDIILSQMSKNSNGGKVDYNDIRTKQGSFYSNII